MKKYLSLLTVAVLLLGLLTGCMGTPVVVNDCTCPDEGTTNSTEPSIQTPVVEGAVKTGLAVITTATDSTSATADAEGAVKLDSTLVAVTVDDAGVINSCIIDSIPATVNFDTTGTITSDITAEVPTKNELGEAYGMKAYAGSKYEWNEQAAAFAAYVTGKTAEEVAGTALTETTAPAEADLASSVTISVGGFMALIEKIAK